jgi:4-carboxymuconolactone decarboxylase
MLVRTLRVLICLAAGVSLTQGAFAQTRIDAPGVKQPARLSKPRIAPLPEAQWTDAHKQLVAQFGGGKADNAFATLLNLPPLAQGLMPYTVFLSNESSLVPRQRQLLILRAAWLAGNQPLWATHTARAREAGLNDAEIRRIAEGPDAKGWSPFEATLLRTADQLYRNSSITDATWKALSAEYDMNHLMDAIETINHFVVLSMVYNSFGVQPDGHLKDRLPNVPYKLNVPSREPALKTARMEAPAGRGLAVSRTFALYPALNQPWSRRQNFIQAVSKLMPRHREMLILRMGWNCRSEYEWAQHVGRVGRAREIGLDPVKIAEGPASPAWDAFEKNILRVADEQYRDGLVSDKTWAALGERFDQSLIMSAVMSAAGYRAVSMSLNSYGVQFEPETTERFPDVPGR